MKNTKQINSFVKNMRLRNLSNRTIDSYVSVLNQLFLSVDEYAERINKVQIEDYLLTIKKANTRNQTLGCLKSFFNHIGRNQLLMLTPYSKVPKSLPKIISKEKYLKGFIQIKNSKHRLIVELLFSHGMRIGEVVNISVSWFGSQIIDDKKHYTLSITGKGVKDRIIVLSNRTVNLLVIYAEDYNIDLHLKKQSLFKGQNTNKYSTTSIRKVVNRYFGVNPHTLRHSCATELVNQNINLRLIQNLLGHSNSKTTEIYTHISTANMLEISA